MKTLLVTMDFPPLLGGVANYYANLVKKMPVSEVVVLADTTFVIPAPDQSRGQAPAGIQEFNNRILDQRRIATGNSSEDDNKKIYRKNFFTRFFWPHWLPLVWHIWRVVKKEKITRLWAGQVLPVGTAVWIVSKIFSCCYRIFYCHSRPVSLYGVNSSGNLIVPRDPHFREDDKKERNDKKFSFFITCHGNDLLRAKRNKRKFWLAKKILTDAEFVEANTEFTKNILIKNFAVPEEKIKVVYPENILKKEMIDEKKVSELREKYNLTGKKVLLTVARLVESKGIGQVLRALPKVLGQVPDLVYLVVGDGPYYPELVRIVNEYLKIPPLTPPCKGGDESGRAIFVGAVPHNNLPNYYALADAFILTPYAGSGVGAGFKPAQDTESFGIVYLEAMEFGLPIIAGDVGGAREAIGNYDKASFVNSENIDEIAEKIKYIFKN